MTFQDFQALCDQAVNSNQQVTAPCPIIIGEGDNRAYLGDTIDHHLIIFKTDIVNAALQDIYRTVKFSFDASGNQVVIKPITHV